ncbi:hypothetical protein EIN_184920 [Entamoeba invadens IP1]|uniref:hypothetical protein n=1 Tax=Entamoeba invadens IP1 TaxID=370355 RepID=UPI0002C3D79B|nr:hypothetical protein EIN_184920 [Entamoeba invadens IP1]ELP94115.1 hypothetical protein EIN_184920 [Entamoeba invadens IP1]|eukprot:XP_004260886.1 hypothetical protein EIN_184920 [Entamoeba invadens IP1]
MNASTLKKGVVEFEKGKLTFDCKTSKMRYKRIEKLYLPSKITLFGVSGHAKVNMSAFGQLTSLECLCDAYCVLKNLMHLIEFTLKGKADTVPASVEQLILKENATIDIIPKENNVIRLFTESRFVGVAAFTQLEKLKLARLEIPPLEMLTKLTALDLFQCFYHAGVSFPSSLKSLHIEKMALDDHFIKMASQNCCLSEMKLVDSVLWENSLNRFNVEKLFYSGSSTPLLPTSIKTLELWTLDTRIDISSLSNLKQLALNNACSNSFVFPKHIKTLIIGICDRIDNFENLRIDNLYISFPHQLEEWANQWVTTLRTDTSFNVTNVAKLFPNLRKESGEW